MNENEIMNVEEVVETVELIPVEVCEGDGGSNFGKVVLIGVGLAGAGFALYKFGKKVWTKIKAKKQAEIEASMVNEDYDSETYDVEDQ